MVIAFSLIFFTLGELAHFLNKHLGLAKYLFLYKKLNKNSIRKVELGTFHSFLYKAGQRTT